MVSKARMRSWFATTEFFVVIAMFVLIAGLLANGQAENSRTSYSRTSNPSTEPPSDSAPTIQPQPAASQELLSQELLAEFDRSAIGQSDLVADPFTPTLSAIDLTEAVNPTEESSTGESSSGRDFRAVPEPTVFVLLGSLAALFLLVNRMRSLCG